jgi:hypothetical protein
MPDIAQFASTAALSGTLYFSQLFPPEQFPRQFHRDFRPSVDLSYIFSSAKSPSFDGYAGILLIGTYIAPGNDWFLSSLARL